MQTETDIEEPKDRLVIFCDPVPTNWNSISDLARELMKNTNGVVATCVPVTKSRYDEMLELGTRKIDGQQ